MLHPASLRQGQRRTLPCGTQCLITLIMSSAFLLTLCPPSSAEIWLGVHFGRTDTQNDQVSASHRPFIGVETTIKRETDFHAGKELALRATNWSDTSPAHGAILEAAIYEAHAPNVSVNVLEMSALYTYRMRLMPSKGYDNGRLQPNLGIGFALVTAYAEIDYTPELVREVAGPSQVIGIDLRTGLTWLYTPDKGVFVEIRRTMQSLSGSGGFLESWRYNIDLNTTHTVIGMTWKRR